jgi:quercetin dioxygenase-like cupin family protein
MLFASTLRTARRAALAAPPFLLALGILLGSSYRAATREEAAFLLSTGETVLGQTISYPAGKPAKVTAAIITMLPGEATGWHQHDVPMFDYILEGEVTVDYGAQGTRVYRTGEAVMEAIAVAHNGRNTGSGPARILAVFMGADSVPNTVLLKGDASVPVQPPLQ